MNTNNKTICDDGNDDVIKSDKNCDDDGKNGASKRKNGLNCLGRLSFHVSTAIAEFFYRLGYTVAIHPWKTIAGCWIIVLICSAGFLMFHNEKDPMKLWIPKNSKFLHDTNWLIDHYEEGNRIQSVLISAPNVLEPEVLSKIALITEEIMGVSYRDTDNKLVAWDDVCFKIPIISAYTSKRRRRRDVFDDDFFKDDEEEKHFEPKPKKKHRPFNPSVDLLPSIYCSLINKLPVGCMEQNLLELWKYDRRKIDKLSKEEIIETLNTTKISPTTGHEMEYVPLLGGVKYDENGKIISASSLLSFWMVHVNFSETDSAKSGNIAGTEDWVSEKVALWENKFLDKLMDIKKNFTNDNFTVHYAAGRSYGDISAAAMFDDMDKLFVGGFLMFVYMQLVLSKFSWTEIRAILGSLGLLSVGMGFISGCGICSVLGISYGPVHTSLPFLLMGLGVDDIFVMMACFRKVQSNQPDKTLPERMGLMLKHAGASITVTSLTDIVAFVVGATTVLPSLQSFCLYAAVNVFLMFFFVITFFVAIFTLDERRVEARRNALIPCIIHDEKMTNAWCDKQLMHRFLKLLYSKILLTTPGKIIVILTVILLTGFNIEGVFKLRQKFDPNWFIPEDTYYNKYVLKMKEMYPEHGYEASILMGELNYTAEIHNIMRMSSLLENRTDILHDVKSWVVPFRDFVDTYYDKDIEEIVLTDQDFKKYLSQFLFSSAGGKFQPNFKFSTKLKCGESAPNITVSTIDFKFKKFSEREEYLPAKYAVENIVKDCNLNGFSALWAKVFGNWVTDEIIDEEIFRNICLALIGVMACSAVLIVNLQICFWIFICVLLTLVNVGGLMQRWGLTLDLVSCIALQLAVGLCVDYAAHIGHTFLTINEGNRNQRALETVLHIGAAVVYGGGSTILALSMLSTSDAYTYRTFFKIFLLVIIFGLFHGIVLLPVILSIFGPSPYSGVHLPRKSSRSNSITKPVEMISFIDKTKQNGQKPQMNGDTQKNGLLKNIDNEN